MTHEYHDLTSPKTKTQDEMTRDVYMMLGDINGKLTLALERNDRIELHQKEMQKRVNNLEKSRSWLLGAIAVVVFAAGWIREKIIGVFM